jgi:nagB: glucosamine-6-phosphate isomerase
MKSKLVLRQVTICAARFLQSLTACLDLQQVQPHLSHTAIWLSFMKQVRLTSVR